MVLSCLHWLAKKDVMGREYPALVCYPCCENVVGLVDGETVWLYVRPSHCTAISCACILRVGTLLE